MLIQDLEVVLEFKNHTGQSGAGTGFYLTTSVSPCQYYPTSAPYSFIYHLRYIILVLDSVVK